ncbi:MAG: sporulation protein YqfD [Clostridia bacterium]
MWNSIQGCVIIQCTGRNPERFLNLLRTERIPVMQVHSSARGELNLTIHAADFKRIRPLVRTAGCKVHILGRRGVPFILWRLRCRPALWIMMALMLISLAIASTRIMRIRITGLDRIPEEMILRAIGNEGIHLYGPLPDDDFLEIAAMARMYDERIAWISFEKKGATLIVKVTEKEPLVVTVDPAQPCDVVAVKDGIIVNAEVYKGYTKLKPGDAVSAGDILIQGEFFPDTPEVVLEPLRVHARGRIVAQINYFSEYVVDGKTTERVDSGNQHDYRAVTLLGWTLYETPMIYEDYEITDVSSLPLTNCMLPIFIKAGVCREQIQRAAVLSKAERTEEALVNAEQLAYLKIPKDALIVQKLTRVVEQDGVTIGIVGIVTQESIGLTREIES